MRLIRDKDTRVIVLGTGNVAWHLAQILEKSGFEIVCLAGRNELKANELGAKLYDPIIQTHFDFRDIQADILIMAVSDTAIASLASEIQVPENCLVVHTSGAVPLSALDALGKERVGVLYPLQTFTKDKKVVLKKTPICIESYYDDALEKLSDIALALSSDVYRLNSQDRKVLHVAAVFACNFTNHLLSVSESLLQSRDLPLGILRSLVEETIQKAFELGPEKGQTGPAVRRDNAVLKAHMNLLNAYSSDQKVLYALLSKSIMDQFYPKDYITPKEEKVIPESEDDFEKDDLGDTAISDFED